MTADLMLECPALSSEAALSVIPPITSFFVFIFFRLVLVGCYALRQERGTILVFCKLITCGLQVNVMVGFVHAGYSSKTSDEKRRCVCAAFDLSRGVFAGYLRRSLDL